VHVSWQPFGDGSSGKSFLAPQLYDLYGPQGAGSTDSITYVTAAGVTQKDIQFEQVSGSNPNLKPETANSWTAGAVYSPKFLKGLVLSVDYSDIYEKQVFGTVPAATIIQDVETKGANSPYVGLVHFNDPTGNTPTAPGSISARSPQQVFVLENIRNLSAQRIDSTDFTLDYGWTTQSIGKFELTSVWTLYNRYLQQLIPTEPFYDYVGTASTTQGTTIPRWRTYTNVDWKFAGFDSFVGWTYVRNVTDVGVGGSDSSSFKPLASYNQFDLGVGYDFGHLHANRWLDGLSINLGVNNVANQMPPTAPTAFPDTYADVGTYGGTYGAVGRMWYVGAKYKF
jgi:iron complex outermembrane receptor protein